MSCNNLAIPIQRAFNDLLDRIGTWVIYTRSDPRYRCQFCHDLDTASSRPNCVRCFGTGFLTQLQRWKVVYTSSLRRAGTAEMHLELEGWANETDPYIISRKEDIPRQGDYFFIVEWNQPRDRIVRLGGQPVRIIQVLRTLNVEPQVVAEVCYYINHTELVTEAMQQFAEALFATPITVSRE